MPEQRSAIVIGAGVVGMATCYALSRRGWMVTLLDAANAPAAGASHANGAQLSYCYTDALASPAVLRSIPAMLAGKGGLQLSPSMDPGFASWLMRFMRNCTAKRFRQNTRAALQLAHESRDAMEALLAKHNVKFGHRIAGKRHLYFSQEEFENAQQSIKLKQDFACEQQIHSAQETLAAEPSLQSSGEDIAGSILTPTEAVGDPLLFSKSLLRLLLAEYCMTVRFEANVERIDCYDTGAQTTLQSGEILDSDLVVVCGGSSSNRLLRPLGAAQPILPMKGYSFEMPLSPTSPHCSITDTKRRIVFTNLGDRMRVAGLADLGNADTSIDPEKIEFLISDAQQSLAGAGDYSRAGQFWAGLRPMSPNSLPVIAQPRAALAINVGHGMLGWTMAMGSGERLARLVSSPPA